MTAWIRRCVFLVIVACIVIGQPGLAQVDDPLYFPQTGHSITGDFLKAYQRAENPLLVYGYPITEEYLEEETGQKVQYFQRARFVFRPSLPPELQVQLSPLGEYLYTPGKLAVIEENTPECQPFSTRRGKLRVCYAFLVFFNDHGGLAQFGEPISNAEWRNERIVQYFQRARFEWYPEYPTGHRVVLANVGREYFDQRRESLTHLPPRDNVPFSVLSLSPRAYMRTAVAPVQGEQTIFVVVRDQTSRPVADAKVTVFAFQPGDGRDILLEPVEAPPTNQYGVTSLTFRYTGTGVGVAEVGVAVSYKDLSSWTKTSFRLWW
jgi:hypothetical protein